MRPVASAYTVGSDTTITIAAGDTINASDTVVITAVNNTQDAPNRDVTVLGVMSNTQGAGSVTGAALTLTDDDVAPDVTMVLSPASISENGAISTVTATLSHTVERGDDDHGFSVGCVACGSGRLHAEYAGHADRSRRAQRRARAP